jgi:hypothetical protein
VRRQGKEVCGIRGGADALSEADWEELLTPDDDSTSTPLRGSSFPSLPLALDAGTLATEPGYPAASDTTTHRPWMPPVSPSPSPIPSTFSLHRFILIRTITALPFAHSRTP